MNDWKSFDEIPQKDKPAIYKIRWKDHKPLDRLIGKDKHCIMSIGETNNIRKRMRQFKRGFDTGGEGTHSAGRTLYGINKYTGLNITIDDMEYSYILKDSKPDAQEAEKEAIWGYVEQFGETPPLNGAIPKRTEWIEK